MSNVTGQVKTTGWNQEAETTENIGSNLVASVREKKIKGFLADDEAMALYSMAVSVVDRGPCLEVGSYCGKSTVFLGTACQKAGSTLYSVDHHQGSEEHQFGEEYHDPDLYNRDERCMDTFPTFRKTVAGFNLVETVVPVVTSSFVAARDWKTPLSCVFIDGGHSDAMSKQDALMWSQFILPGGLFLIHDIFEYPDEGGQGPFLAMQAVLDSGDFEYVDKINSLGVLRRF